MKAFFTARRASLATLALAVPAAMAFPPVIDGLNINSTEYGSALTVQRYDTGFGTDSTPGQFADRAELDAMFVTNDEDNLYIGVSGNLQRNGNCMVVFIDSNGASVGANFLLFKDFGVPVAGLPRYLAGDEGGNSGFDNMIFDLGFAPDFVIGMSGGSPVASETATYQLVNLTTLADNFGPNPLGHTNEVLGLLTQGDPDASGPAGTLGEFLNSDADGILASFDNSETNGVGSGSCGAPGSAVTTFDPLTQTAGFEYSIPLAKLGVSEGDEICVFAAISNENGFISNQILPPPATETNFACIGDRSAGTITFDFGTLSGDQYVCYTLAAPPTCPNPQVGCDRSDLFPAGGDCIVNLGDLGQLLANYQPGVGGKTRAQGDIFPLGGGDGIVDLGDLGQVLSDFNTNCQ